MGPFGYGDTASVEEPRVNLTLKDIPVWSAVNTPTVGQLITLRSGTTWCAASVVGDDGRTYSCSLPYAHESIPHTACVYSYEYEWISEYDAPRSGWEAMRVVAVAEPTITDPDELNTELAKVREELVKVRAQLKIATERADMASDRADTAEEKISDIRDYVIARKNDREICAAGTLRFLREFDLPGWEQNYTVHYGDFSFEVEAMSYAQAAGRAKRAMRNAFDSGNFPYHIVDYADLWPTSIDDEEGDTDSYPYDGDDDES